MCASIMLCSGLPIDIQAAPAAAGMPPLVVTAEQDPATILLASDLKLFQVDSVAGLSGMAPGLAVVTSDTRGYGDIISMRGSANTLFFSPPAVGMVVDDVPMGDTYSYPAGLLEMDQVKVLRGPQGTIYGRNGAAGMLDMTTPRPGVKTVTSLTTEYGSYDAWNASVRSGGPLGAGFSQTFQLYHQQRDGLIYNPTFGRATDDRSLTGGLANLYWKPAADTEWRLRVAVERADDGGPRLSLLDNPDRFQVASDIPGKAVMERQQVSVHWTKEGPWGRLKSITAWQNWQLDPSVTDLDLRNDPVYGKSSIIVQDQRMWTQEFRWESPDDASPWTWRAGMFFMNQASSGDTTRELFGPYFTEHINYQLDQWNVAAYGRVSYAINPRLKLSAGARLEYVDAELDRLKTSTSYFGPAPAPAPVNDGLGAWYCSPELGASYALCETTRLFARSAIGIKPAGFSAFVSDAALARYDEELAWTNELGAEVAVPDYRLTFSLAAFWNRINDYQLNRSTLSSTDYYTVNAGPVTALGAESSVRWQPLAGLTVQGSVGLVQAQFDAAPNAGKAVPFVPAFTGSLGARYDLPQGFYVQSAVRMTGTTYFEETNDDRYRQGSYLCWDAEIGYAMEHFSVALYGRNMLDRGYYTYINNLIGAGSPGDPQIFGVRATLEF